MNTQLSNRGIDRPLVWTTAALGIAAGLRPLAPCALDAHLATCSREDSHLIVLRCLAQRLNAFVAPRFVTTITLATVLAGVIVMLG